MYCSFDPGCQDLFGPIQDIGSLRSQSLDTLGGKVIRIDPETGNGIGPDNFPTLQPNPFYDATQPQSPRSRIWLYGLRNPFRFIVRPDQLVTGPGTSRCLTSS